MEILALYTGLLLPWLGGTLWLIFIESRFSRQVKPNLYRQVGYGFFLGYAFLFLAIIATDSLTGAVVWYELMIFLLIFTAFGGLALWLGARNRAPERMSNNTALAPNESPSVYEKVLAVFLLLLISFHFLFFTVEILTQPVFPWDAWFTWVYKAKVWFLVGNMAEMVSPTTWAASRSAEIYSINAWTYPLFPSVIPYWSVLSLGRWSETLVNLPVLIAGLAIGLALYGQCRETGFSRVSALVCCYLLYSIPLFGTHIALAGYADIWLAGFAGLGFIAIMRGAISRQVVQTALGFLMVMIGIWVKNEGAVWFLAAIGLQLLLIGRLRVHFISALVAVGLVSAAFMLGIQQVEIPLLGTIGITNDQLMIPFFGTISLEIHNIWLPYLENFLAMGSWNLLWVMVICSLWLGIISVTKTSSGPELRAGLSFIFIFIATQLFIFGFTEQGEWAERYSAINRLPLHFVPAILFSAVVIVHSLLKQSDKAGSPLEHQSAGP